MTHILCLESSTETCSVCIQNNDGELFSTRSKGKYSHSSELSILIKKAMDNCQVKFDELAAVSVSQGPGSFTSLRVGHSMAKAICYAMDIPLIAISSLKIIAFPYAKRSFKRRLIIPMIDARRNEVYMSVFDGDLKTVEPPQAVILESSIFKKYDSEDIDLIICGNAMKKAESLLSHMDCTFSEQRPNARDMIKLSYEEFRAQNFADISSFVPFYLKPPNITIPSRDLFKN